MTDLDYNIYYADFLNIVFDDVLVFIDLDNLEAGDRARIENLNLSEQFVELICMGSDSFNAAERERLEALIARDLDAWPIGNRLLDAICGILHKAKSLLCPFTGENAFTTTTVDFEVYGYWCDGRTCLIAQFADVLCLAATTAYLFPHEGVVLYFGKSVASETLKRSIDTLVQNLATHAECIAAHHSQSLTTPVIAVAEMKAPHLGHFIWNVLSAWGNLFEILPDLPIQRFLTWEANRFTGSVSELYPKEAPPDKCLTLRDDGDLIKYACDSGALIFFIKDGVIPESAANRTLAFNYRRCDAERLEDLRALRRNSTALILFSLRIGNRAWIEQIEGYNALASALHARYPNIAFIIDGISCDSAKGWTHRLMPLEEEGAAAASIRASIECHSPCYTTSGMTMAESIVGSDLCDFFVAPAGSALAKYKWLANKPGIVISNSVVLDRRNPRGWNVRVFEHHRPALRPSVFVAPDVVVNVPAAGRPGDRNANFHLSWPEILRLVEPLMSQCERHK